MNVTQVLLLFLVTYLKASFDLGGLFVSVVKGIHSAYQQIDQTASSAADPNSPSIRQTGVSLNDFEEYPDAQLCAVELSHKLTSAIIADDEFSQRTCQLYGNWRHLSSPSFIPLAIGCTAEKLNSKKAKIVCRAEIEGRREIFARYWAYFPDSDIKGDGARKYKTRIQKLIEFGKSLDNPCLNKLFGIGHGTWLWSPFHPERSHFDVQFRKFGLQKICRVILDPAPENAQTRCLSDSISEPPVAIDYLSNTFPKLFHRLMSDVFNNYPEECKGHLPVGPTLVTDLGNAKKHIERTLELLGVYRYGLQNSRFTATLDTTNACNPETGGATQTPLSRLTDRISKCLYSQELQYFRCDQGLSIWSGSKLCPPTSACYDADICNRMVSCGDGLWLAIRGQNVLESGGRTAMSWIPVPERMISSLSSYAPSYDYDPTTQSFYEFGRKPDHPYISQSDDQVIWHKLHINTKTSGMFLIVFYHPPSDMSGFKYAAQTSFDFAKRKEDRLLAELASRIEKSSTRKSIASSGEFKQRESRMGTTIYHSLSSSDSDEMGVRLDVISDDGAEKDLVYPIRKASSALNWIPNTSNSDPTLKSYFEMDQPGTSLESEFELISISADVPSKTAPSRRDAQFAGRFPPIYNNEYR